MFELSNIRHYSGNWSLNRVWSSSKLLVLLYFKVVIWFCKVKKFLLHFYNEELGAFLREFFFVNTQEHK